MYNFHDGEGPPMHSSEWWKGFKYGTLSMLLFCLLCAWGLSRMGKQTAQVDAAAMLDCQVQRNQLQKSLNYCRSISQSNYQVASAAQVENRQLRALVMQYQAQIQKGQAPSGLAEFLLKLLIK